ncbi:excinuclease ABC subunit C [Balneicella halophila]|uniref:UvrABC system protein C n=1 Tax=Balneicella halophila TaxID=1537566 RepID=A0A7L4URG3_BALHA|nr:excinuclease ABC subunit UvrC [Balneicella halophila]PVX52102.1 excinuclease ABC subunit C [Balneicella halophila]
MSTSEINLSPKEQARQLPLSPGVYQFYDAKDIIIYVGKAKSLRKRVLSYFTKKPDSGKLRVLVSKIVQIQHIVVQSEQDALLLENSLIKEYQPRYNIQLRDDKTYPWICIKNEHFPRVFMTRRKVNDGSIYYGPYTSVKMVRSIMDVVRSLYKLRTCKLDLSPRKIEQGRYKVCLEYHIENCKGPCVGLQSEADYLSAIDEIKKLLSGNLHSLMLEVKQRMLNYAENFDFEKAQLMKDKLDFLERYQSKSVVVSSRLTNLEVYAIVDDEKVAYVNRLFVVEGRVLSSHTLEIKKKLDETKEDLLISAIVEFRSQAQQTMSEIVLPYPVEYELDNVNITVPQRGEKVKLLEFSKRNALYFRREKLEQATKRRENTRDNALMKKMKRDLRLPVQPRHIECFDNSNIHGTNPVASCVVFKNGRPSKKDYRKFHIKTVVGADDFASMNEVLNRRYGRMIQEGDDLPDLIVVDGGKGQLSSAVEALKALGIFEKVSVIGIAKRLEELYYPGDKTPLYLDKRSETLRVLQHMRNEAHRFAISFHRDVRSKNSVGSELESIDGIGSKSVQALLGRFHSVEGVKSASLELLVDTIGRSRALKVHDYFKKRN